MEKSKSILKNNFCPEISGFFKLQWLVHLKYPDLYKS